ncbi:uncharacterized protein ARMOST_20402 [Armillaria ostoyae]|uniref:Uncharacterized protein n=1 Tax=Armillaria ostoyae TaxID=47428 RepID=A0A284S786_ARMOS|nr:uncharacterized protein ARMOST_20402 [Armillaria ostoyae]
MLYENIGRESTIAICATRGPTFGMHALRSSSAYSVRGYFVPGHLADDGILYLLVALLFAQFNSGSAYCLHQILINANFSLPHNTKCRTQIAPHHLITKIKRVTGIVTLVPLYSQAPNPDAIVLFCSTRGRLGSRSSPGVTSLSHAQLGAK